MKFNESLNATLTLATSLGVSLFVQVLLSAIAFFRSSSIRKWITERNREENQIFFNLNIIYNRIDEYDPWFTIATAAFDVWIVPP